VPIEAGEGSVLLALVLKKEGTLFNSKFFQVSGKKEKKDLLNSRLKHSVESWTCIVWHLNPYDCD
jgi:hypothetical protein